MIIKRFFKMATSRFVEVTVKEINNCFKENAYFSKNHLCNYTETIIHPRFGEYYTLDVWSRGKQLVLFSRES